MTGDRDAVHRPDVSLARDFEPAQGDRGVVSIVVAVRNDLSRLQRLVVHTKAAALGPIEIVVIDGGSSDGTREWLASLDQTGPVSVRWLSEPDNGIPDAWNRGVKLARGEWIVFLGADDAIYDAAAWRRALEKLQELPPACGIAVFSVAIVSPAGQVLATELGAAAVGILAGERIAHQGMFHRRTLWTECGGFDTSFRLAADYEFCLRACRKGVSVEAFPGSPVVAMTFGGRSKHSPLATLRELRRAQRSHGITISSAMRWAESLRAWLRWVGMTILPPSVIGRCADAARRVRGLPPVWTVP